MASKSKQPRAGGKDLTDRQHQGIEGDWISVGTLRGAHGVRGDIRLVSYMEDTGAIFKVDDLRKGPNGPVVQMRKLRNDPKSGGFIVRMEGVGNREAAQALSGTELYAARGSFEASDDEDEFFLADLIGLEVFDEANEKRGHVRSFENFGAGDLLEVVLDEPLAGIGRFAFVPFTKALVPDVEVDKGRITVALEAWGKTQISERDGVEE